MPFHWPDRSLDGLWHTVPVDVFELARRYGLEIHDRFLPDEVGGIMHKFEGKSYLYLNRIHQPERGRFTVAHELAHHLAHRTGIYMSSPFGSKPQERLADEIAAEILMPAAEVRRCRREGMGLEEMAKHFIVSKEAIRIRVEQVEEEERQRTAQRLRTL